MTKSVDKYEILNLKPLLVDSVQYYAAREKQGNKNFILKRLKVHNNIEITAAQTQSDRQFTNEQFELLKNQTLILKTLDNPSIPKCLRILKTTNSVYFVYETYPLVSLGDYLRKEVITFQKKVTISLNIINAVDYLHKQGVVWRGINQMNIKINDYMNVFMTDFTRAKCFQSIHQKLKSINQHKRQHQFKSLLNQDLLHLAKLISIIFHFHQIQPQYHHFVNQKEKYLYEALSQGLLRKFHFITFQNLIRILTKKQKLKIQACLSTQQSFDSISTNSPQKCRKINKNNYDGLNQRILTIQFTSTNKKKNYQKTATKIVSTHFIQPQSIKRISTFPSENCFKEQKFRFSDQQNSAVQRFQKQKQREREQIKKKMLSILTTRKIINLILHCIQKISKFECENDLIYLLAMKCEWLAFNEQKQIQLCFLQSISTDEKQALKQLKKQNIKTIITLQIVKQSIRQIINQCDSSKQKQPSNLLQFTVQNQGISSQKISEKLYKAIYRFLDKELRSFRQKYPEIYEIKDNKLIDQNDYQLYEEFRLFYYLSIKLKYRSYEVFFEKKNNFQTAQLDILKEEYLAFFENYKIPLKRIINEVQSRMEMAIKS